MSGHMLAKLSACLQMHTRFLEEVQLWTSVGIEYKQNNPVQQARVCDRRQYGNLWTVSAFER